MLLEGNGLLPLPSAAAPIPLILTRSSVSPSFSEFLTYFTLGTNIRDTIADEDTAMIALARKTLASGLSCSYDKKDRS